MGLDNHKSFNFDLERMKEALAAPSHIMPSNLTFKEFQEWMKFSYATMIARTNLK